MSDENKTERKLTSAYWKPFKPEYCEQLIDHMAEGYSFEAFCGKIGVAKQTAYTWVKQHAEFAEAKEIGFEKNRLFWEHKGIEGLWGDKDSRFNSTVWVFNMKNRHGWRDRVEMLGKDGGPIQYADLSEEQIDAKMKELCAQLGQPSPETNSQADTDQEDE
jgi:hypothetical protein